MRKNIPLTKNIKFSSTYSLNVTGIVSSIAQEIAFLLHRENPTGSRESQLQSRSRPGSVSPNLGSEPVGTSGSTDRLPTLKSIF